MIYPDYTTFVKAYLLPPNEKTKKLTKRQESARKEGHREGVWSTQAKMTCSETRYMTMG